MGQIVLKQVQKKFGDLEVIPPLDLTIEDGEFTVFVGPSGCGKSTLLRLIAGLEDVTAGSISIDGNEAADLPPAKRGLAMVFQSYALYPHMTVRKNIAFPLRMAKMDAAEIDKRVANAAQVLNLGDYLERRPGQLSGGQRQRVAIGRAIVRDPKAFLFDEPLSNLDAALRVQMRLEIVRLQRELATTTIYVTHDQVEAMTMASRIALLKDGVIEQVGTPLDLYHHPRNLFVACFIGSPAMNILPCKIDGERVSFVPMAAGRPRLGARPEHIRIDDDGCAATVIAVEHLGGDTLVYARLQNLDQSPSDQSPIAVRSSDEKIAVGDALSLRFDPRRCHLFDLDGRVMDTSKIRHIG